MTEVQTTHQEKLKALHKRVISPMIKMKPALHTRLSRDLAEMAVDFLKTTFVASMFKKSGSLRYRINEKGITLTKIYSEKHYYIVNLNFDMLSKFANK